MIGDFGGQTVFGAYTLMASGTGSDAYYTKLDNNGNVLWSASFGGTGNENGWTLDTDSLGTTVFYGTYDSPSVLFFPITITNPTPWNTASFLVKINNNNNIVWAENIFTSGDGFIYSVSIDKYGNIYAGGILTSSIVTIGSYTFTGGSGGDAFISKYDVNGNLIWAKKYYKSSTQSVDCDNNGDVYITGSFWDTTISLGTYTLTNSGSSNYFLAKLDSSGNVLWAKSGLNNGDSEGSAVSVDKYGVFVSGGFFTNLLIDTFLLSAPSGSIRPLFIAKYDFNGKVLCANVLSSGGANEGDIIADGNGGAVIADSFEAGTMVVGSNTLTTTAQWTPFIAKYFCSSNIGIGINELSFKNNFKICPNPNNGSFKLQIDNDIVNGEIIIYNSLGQKVHEQKIISGENNITTTNLPQGLYHYSLLQNKQLLQNGKIVVE